MKMSAKIEDENAHRISAMQSNPKPKLYKLDFPISPASHLQWVIVKTNSNIKSLAF